MLAVAQASTPYGGTAALVPGRIELEKYDVGGEGIAYHDSDATNSGGQLRSDGVDIGTCVDTGCGHSVGTTAAGEWLKYTVSVGTSGVYRFIARANGTGTFHIEVDGIDATGVVSLASGSTWTNVVKPNLYLGAGNHVLRLVVDSSTGLNLNWIELSNPQTPFGGTARAVPGRIEAEDYDVGGPGTSFYDSLPGAGSAPYRTEAVALATCNDTACGYANTGSAAGNWTEYTVTVATSAYFKLNLRAANTGAAHVEIDDRDVTGTLTATTGSTTTWQTLTKDDVYLESGMHVVRLVIETAGIRTNWIELVSAQTPFGGTPRAIPGTIEAEDYDLGGSGIAFGNGGGSAPTAYRADGQPLSTCNDSTGCGYALTAGFGWAEYTVNVATTGNYSIGARIRTNTNYAMSMHLELDGVNITGPNNQSNNFGGWGPTYTLMGGFMTAGKHRLRLVVDTNNFDVGQMTFTFNGASSSRPAVSMTAPMSGTVAKPPANLTLTAAATAYSSRTISKVEFFYGQKLLNSDTTYPYTYTWAQSLPGTYQITAKATDNTGAFETTAPVTVTVQNQAPSTWLIAPLNGSAVNAGTNVTLSADATDYDGTVSKVEFYDGATLLGSDTTAPYSFTWNSVPAGPHTISAIATDEGLATQKSNLATLNVNALPVVTLSAANAVVLAPATFSLTATASDSDGTVAKVEFLNGATVLCTDTTSPYTCAWSGVAAGTYSITAKAYDNAGATNTSASLALISNLAPAAAINSPTANQNFTPPANVVIDVSASDSDGSVATLEFRNGAALLGSDSTAPYSFTWSGLSKGSYVATAKAIDNQGAATSANVAFTVDWPPTISISVPHVGYATPADIVITANVSDQDSPSPRVEFYNGPTLLGFKTAPPYTYTLASVPVGSYTLTAKAIDDLGVTTTSNAVTANVGNPPTSAAIEAVGPVDPVDPQITLPFNVYPFGSSITLTASASAVPPATSIASVEYFLDSASIGSSSVAPYSVVWANAPLGNPAVTARITDNRGVFATVSRTIKVENPPTLHFSDIFARDNPSTSTWIFAAPATIEMHAYPMDSEGPIAKVEFYKSNVLMGTVTQPPFNFRVENVSSGSYGFKARAYDSDGLSVSKTLGVTVRGYPTERVLQPTEGAAYSTTQGIPLASSCARGGAGGYFDGSTLIWTDTRAVGNRSIPHMWLGGQRGPHSITLRCYDSDGVPAMSIPVNVSLTDMTTTISEPVSGAIVTAGSAVSMRIDVANPDGAVASVQIYDGARRVTVLDRPGSTVSYALSGLGVGPHALMAVAIDDLGSSSRSAPVNITVNDPPSVTLTAPSDGASYGWPASIDLAATSADSDGTVTKVEFLRDGVVLSTDLSAPYMYTWPDVPAGSYELSARAYDDRLAATTSASIHVVVSGNGAPTVSMTGPASGAYNAPAALTLKATAADPDGSISRVEFFDGNGTAPLCSATTPDIGTTTSFSCGWTTSAAGPHSISARAYDSATPAATALSTNPVGITINGVPTVTITAPADGARLVAPASLTLKASAVDTEAPVSKVEFYDTNGTTLLCAATMPDSGTTTAFSCNWNAPSVGSHAISARAYDNATSAAVATTAIRTNITIDSSPGVSVVVPVAGLNYLAPATVQLLASTNFTGATKVEFLDGGNQTPVCTASFPVATDPTAWTCTWQTSAIGTHTITAKAYSSSTLNSANSVSIVVKNNTPPTITLDSPSESEKDNGSAGLSWYGNAFVAGAGQVMNLKATVTDPDANVRSVQFYLVPRGSSPRLVATVSTGSNGQYSTDLVVDASMASPYVQKVYAVASDGIATSTSRVAPVSIKGQGTSGVPCGAASWTWPCSGTPHAVSIDQDDNILPRTAKIEAERFDSGGQGVGYFKSVAEGSENGRSGEDVQLPYADCQNGPGGQPSACLVGSFRSGEMLAYTIDVQKANTFWLQWKIFRPELEGGGNIDLSLSATNVTLNNSVAIDASSFGTSTHVTILIDDQEVASGGADASYYWTPTKVGRYKVVARADYPHSTFLLSAPQYATVFPAAGGAVATDVGTPPIDPIDPAPSDDVPPRPRVTSVDFFSVDASGNVGDPISFDVRDALPESVTEDGFAIANLTQEGPVTLPVGRYLMRVRQSEKPQPQGPMRSGIAVDWIEFSEYNTSGQVPLKLVSPRDGTSWTVGASIPFATDVVDNTPGAQVQYLACRTDSPSGCNVPAPSCFTNCAFGSDWQVVAQSSSSPFGATWIAPSAQQAWTYKVAMKAYLQVNGGQAWYHSGTSQITINPIAGNKPPAVAFTAPIAGANLRVGDPISLKGTATDDDGTISSVTFYETIGSSDVQVCPGVREGTTNVWSCNWPTAALGFHALKVIAKDNLQTPSPEATLSITVANGNSSSVLATPPAPSFDAVPNPDPDSDKVGATAANFRVDETGNATYSIPISVLPGVAGMQPQLSLTYNSGGGDGLLGVGWNVGGMSAITRCRASRESGDAGGPHAPPLRFPGDHNQEQDQYCLNGQRLISIGTVAHGLPGAEYRTEIDSFSRIRVVDDAYVSGIAGAESFVVEGKDGSKITFGGSKGRKVGATTDSDTDARALVNSVNADGSTTWFQTPTQATGLAAQKAVMSWAQNRVEDTLGNYIDYFYTNLGGGLDGEQVLSEIHYTGNSSQGTSPQSKVVFEYAPRTVSDYYASGARARRSKLLSKISVYAGSQLVRYYTLDYGAQNTGNNSPTTLRSRLAGMQECAPSSAGTICYPKTTFAWTDGAIGVQSDEVVAPGVPLPGQGEQGNWLYDVDTMKYGDVNGDGRTDLVWVRDHMICVSTSNPSGFGFTTTCPRSKDDHGAIQLYVRDTAVIGTGSPTKADPQLAYHLFDFNADGRDDLLVAIDDNVDNEAFVNWVVILSDGTDRPFKRYKADDTTLNTISLGVQLSGIGEAMFVDMDGDGLPDLLNTHSYTSGSGTIGGGPPSCAPNCIVQRPTTNDAFTPRDVDVTPILYRLVKNGSNYYPRPGAPRFGVVQCPMGDDGNRLPYCFPTTDSVPAQADGNVVEFNYATAALGSDAQCMSILNSRQLPLPADGRPDPIDINGDGRADLRARVRANHWDGRNCVASYDPTHYFLMENMGPNDLGRWVFSVRYTQRIGEDAGQVDGIDRKHDYRFQVTDLNGDGLADLFYRKAGGDYWYYRLNTGRIVNGVLDLTAEKTALLLGDGREKTLSLTDIDGDGRADLLYGVDSGTGQSQTRLWNFRRWNGLEFDSTDSPLTNVTSEGGQNSQRSSFVDLDGDGHAEQVLIDYDDDRQVIIRRGAKFERNGTSGNLNRYQPTDVIRSITNGLGATTTISYAPLTQSAVYLPGANTATTTYGRGSPVSDLRTPMYVVQRAQSDANYDTKANIFYRYRGARMQAGGRGFLGFEEVQTLTRVTASEWMEGATVYNQSFPLLGQPKYSRTRPLSTTAVIQNGWTDAATDIPACGALGSGVENDAASPSNLCFRYIAPGARKWPGSGTEKADSVHYAEDLSWAVPMVSGTYGSTITPPATETVPVLPATTPTPMFVVKAKTTSQDREPYKTELSHGEITTFDSYDGNGNLLTSTTTRNAASGTVLGAAVKTVTTANTYADVVDSTRWLLGRLTRTSVTTTLAGSGDGPVTRTSGFVYRLGQSGVNERDGLLAAEIVMPGDARPGVSVIKAYGYDAFGNRVKQAVCDALTVSQDWKTCLATSGANMAFKPGDADISIVRRASSSAFDANGRFLVTSSEAFDSGNGNGVDVTVASIDSRDALGNPTLATGVNGVQTRTGYGAMGRKYFESANTGAAGTSVFRFCTGGNRVWGEASAAATEACPSELHAAYRIETRKNGAPKVYTFYDLLGREVGTLAQSFAANSYSRTQTVYDSFGRVASKSQPCLLTDTNANGPTGTCSSASGSYQYDVLGRPSKVYQPDGTTYTQTTYDTLTVKTELPANKNGYKHTKIETRNVLGEIAKVAETGGTIACYTYSPTGQLRKTIKSSAIVDCATAESAPGAIKTEMTYDSLGRKDSMSDPDKGSWNYGYNAAGELIKQTNSRGCTLSYYDARGRLQRRDDFTTTTCASGTRQHSSEWRFDHSVLGSLTTHYVYGAATSETVTALQTGGGATLSQSKTFGYDGFGRLSTTSTTLENRTYTERATYDQYGRPFQQLMTSPEFATETGVLFEYSDGDAALNPGFSKRLRDAEGQLAGSVYYEVREMDAFGHVIKERHADNVALETTRDYDAVFGRLTNIRTGTGNGIQNWSYQWDPVGNLSSRSDKAGHVESFDYDMINRLLTSKDGTQSITAQNNYDDEGNIRTRSDGTRNFTYTYGGAVAAGCPAGSVGPGPHAASKLVGAVGVNGATGTLSYCYDAVGNQVAALGSAGTSESRNVVYTVADQAAEINATINSGSSSTVRFVYGAGRERIKREDIRGGLSEVTHYVAGAEVVLKNFCSVTQYADVSVRRYFGEMILTQRAQRAGCGTVTASVRRDYRMVDHLGSTDALESGSATPSASDSGTAGSAQAFTMWGQRRDTGNWLPLADSSIYGFDNQLSRKGFTGHEEIDLSGLVHMGGRVYDPRLGRFIQADPFVEDPYLPQTLNRYAYVRNNPLSNTDPSGYLTQGQWLMTAAAVATVYAGGTGATAFMSSATPSVTSAVAVTATTGFVSGVLTTGSIKGGLQGAFTAVALFGAGQLSTALGLAEDSVGRAAIHGATGGILEKVQGGNFGHGFLTAGVGKFASARIDIPSRPADFLAATLIGGTLSAASGGKFANGALSSAMQWAFNEGTAQASKSEQTSKTQAYGERAKKALEAIAATPDGARVLRDIEAAEKIVQVSITENHDINGPGETRIIDLTPRPSLWQILTNAGSQFRYALQVQLNPDFDQRHFYDVNGAPFLPDTTRLLAHELGHVHVFAKWDNVEFHNNQQHAVTIENLIYREIDPKAPERHLTKGHE